MITKKTSKYQKYSLGVSERKYSLYESKYFYVGYKYVIKSIDTANIEYILNLIHFMLQKIYKISRVWRKNKWEDYDPFGLWYFEVKHQVKKLHSRGRIDLILSSSSPFECHVIASKISEELDIPWIADYRDPWTFNHTYKLFNSNQKFFETSVISKANAFVVATKYLEEIYADFSTVPIFVLYNGYKSIKNKRTKHKPNQKIRIVYTGSIYAGFQNYEMILKVISKCQNSKDYEIIFIGESKKIISKYIARHKNANFIRLVGRVSREESYMWQMSADILLVFDWENLKHWGILPTKFFEYMAHDCTILVTGKNSNSELANILKQTNSGVYISNEAELYDFFNKKNFIPSRNSLIEKYSYEAQANKLLYFFGKVLKSLEEAQT